MAKFETKIFINLVAPKATVKCDLLFDEQRAVHSTSQLNLSSTTNSDQIHEYLFSIFWSHFVVLLRSDLDVKHISLCLRNKSSHLAVALGVTQDITIFALNLVTLYGAT